LSNTGFPQQPGKKRFGSVKRQSVTISQESLVRTEYLQPEQRLPLVIHPAIDDVHFIDWTQAHRDDLRAQLLTHGGVLFRGFTWDAGTQFRQFISAISQELLRYQDQATPRTEVGGGIYTSTDYPANQSIELHNENSYAHTWPGKIFFCCIRAAQQGGETPIADSRKVFARLRPEIREGFLQKQVMYMRNFGDNLGITWQTAFQTTERSEMEEYCRCAGIEFEWKGKNRLRTWQIRPAALKHPQTGEDVWFNQATAFHISTLDAGIREALLAELSQEDVPKNAFYGDGTPIEDQVLDEIRAAYVQETVRFPWQEGDILMLDNMLIAHGRSPFVGPRKVVVGMAEPWSWAQIQQSGEQAGM